VFPTQEPRACTSGFAVALDPVSAAFAPEPEAAYQARQFVASAIAPWTTIGDREIAVLLVSELVTNAVVHAQTVIDVEVSIDGSVVHVEVRDRRPDRPIVRGDGPEEHGRGLKILDGLATAWGTTSDGHTKTVWFDLTFGPRYAQPRHGRGSADTWQ
jgi:signal transduction histidine kinase